MIIRKTVVSLIAASVLFTACGGGDGGDDGGVTPGVGDKPTFTTTSPRSYDVVAGSKKSINLAIGKSNMYPSGEFAYRYAVIDKPGSIEIDEGRGIIIYAAPEGSDKLSIQVTAQALTDAGENLGSVSDPITIEFNPVAIPDTVGVKPHPITKALGDYHKNTQPDYDNVIGPDGLEWADGPNVKPGVNFTYQDAADECARTTGFRIPSINELLNLVDYSKAAKGTFNLGPIIPDGTNEFETHDMILVWAEPEYGRDMYFGEDSGVAVYLEAQQPLPVRCVKGDKADAQHLIHSDNRDYTYDETTKLEWSPPLPASTVCSTFSSPHRDATGAAPHINYRVPTINEIRSVIEYGGVSSLITGTQLQVSSSTSYIDVNGTAAGVWKLYLNQNGLSDKLSIGAGQPDTTENVICVRDM